MYGQKNNKINISGIVDRIDFKNNIYRIIDYKTGGDNKNIKSIKSLFSNKKRERNDAVFQLFFYSLLLKNKINKVEKIEPGLMNIRDINRNNFSINISIDNKKVYDINPLLDCISYSLFVLSFLPSFKSFIQFHLFLYNNFINKLKFNKNN